MSTCLKFSRLRIFEADPPPLQALFYTTNLTAVDIISDLINLTADGSV